MDFARRNTLKRDSRMSYHYWYGIKFIISDSNLPETHDLKDIHHNQGSEKYQSVYPSCISRDLIFMKFSVSTRLVPELDTNTLKNGILTNNCSQILSN
jgi:hypothetical protein